MKANTNLKDGPVISQTRRGHFLGNLRWVCGRSKGGYLEDLADVLVGNDSGDFDSPFSYYPILPALLAAIDKHPSDY